MLDIFELYWASVFLSIKWEEQYPPIGSWFMLQYDYSCKKFSPGSTYKRSRNIGYRSRFPVNLKAWPSGPLTYTGPFQVWLRRSRALVCSVQTTICFQCDFPFITPPIGSGGVRVAMGIFGIWLKGSWSEDRISFYLGIYVYTICSHFHVKWVLALTQGRVEMVFGNTPSGLICPIL